MDATGVTRARESRGRAPTRPAWTCPKAASWTSDKTLSSNSDSCLSFIVEKSPRRPKIQSILTIGRQKKELSKFTY